LKTPTKSLGYKRQNGNIVLTGKIKYAGKEYPLNVYAKDVGEIVDGNVEVAVIER